MLQNEMFIGSMVQGRQYTPSYRTKKRVKNDREDWIVVKGMHEPIISEELFELAQKALHSRKIQPRKFALGVGLLAEGKARVVIDI